MAVRPRRPRRKKQPTSKHLTVTATDDEWEMVGAGAARRGLSRARYLVGLAKRDGAETNEDPSLALNAVQQRELLACHREILSLLESDGDTASLIADIQARIAAMFNVWAKDVIARGRENDLHAELARIVGEDQAAVVIASIKRNTTKRPRPRAADTVQPDLFS
ncbi:MAG: hypothetical protein OXQ29_17390 [Rhodospirillaceae bacterium]|nr:hypothetical protein [Rhodospirillaceae bacterium]